jgi:hypothetical protein
VVLLTSVIVDSHGQSTRRFNVSDDIGLTYFGDPFLDKAEAISFSPDDRYFVVHTERGRLDINRPESTLRVYSSDEVRRFLVQVPQLPAPAPIWTFSRATYKDGPVISTLRWLPDSSGFGFLATSPTGTVQLFLGDIRSKRILLLTPPNQDITAFDIRDARHFVYTALSPHIREQVRNENDAASVVGTDRKLTGLLSPVTAVRWHDLSELWAVIGGSRKRIEDLSRHRPLAVHWRGQMALALSPDGHTLLTALTVPYVPSSWTTLYAPPYATDKHHIEPGKQDPDAFDGWIDVSRYVLIDLRTDAIEPLPLGPFGYEADWIGLPYTDWSKDGTAVALTDTFLDRETAATHDQPVRPCAVVVSLRDKRVNCVEPVMGDLENGEHDSGFHEVNGIRFDGPGDDRIVLQYNAGLTSGRSYRRSSEGWTADSEGTPNSRRRFDVTVKEGLNDPPILLATDLASKNSRVLWDPNPWMKTIDIGHASVYHWKDSSGREEVGGLYMPPDYVPGRKYPLVIQTHGFHEGQFVPSGIYPTGFAARELAAAGIMVLQVRGCPIRHTPEEGPCQVAAYESAVRQMTAEGRIDPDHVGIVGFSRTCYYALEAITTSKFHFAAASITDGLDMGYMGYLLADKIFSPDSNAVIGAPPFGEGLKKWLERSPGFNMDKVTTPLLVVGVGQIDIVAEWEPYATLWHQNKPTDLILLKEGTHPLSNPAQRLISQGSTVDWMRYWLLGAEDPDPAKREQYARWHHLRSLQTGEQSESDSSAESGVR